MNSIKKGLMWILVLLTVSELIQAEVKLPKLVSDGIVLQRNVPLKIWGWASSLEKVNVLFLGKTYSATANEKGEWSINLPKLKAGGPFEMTIEASNKIILKDILVGDVWICSGQSNMQTLVSRVQDLYKDEIANCENSFIRQYTVPMKYDFTKKLEDISGGKCESTNSKSIMNFSAVAYFFSKNLYEKYHVPIGTIISAVGGTPIEAWISADVLKDFPSQVEMLKKVQAPDYVENIMNNEKQRDADWYSTLNNNDLGYKGPVYWKNENYDASSWKEMILPGFWSETELGRVNGVVWFRKEFEVSKSFLDKTVRLDLGRIVDSDSAFVNGKYVGNITYQYPPRVYSIPAGILKEGKNVIVVRVVNNAGRGGFIKDKPYQLSVDKEIIDLKGEWQYKLGATAKPLPPTTFFQYYPTGLYNGMIAPLANYSIKGFLWYQGESNTGRAKEYQKLFPALINDWRVLWNNQKLPFVYAQLPNYMEPKEQPSESQWAELREAQMKTLSVPYTAMAVTIDLGEWNDIHPFRKKDVGDRLATAAKKVAYSEEKIIPSGPIFKSAKIKKNKVIVTFKNVGKGLISKDGKELKYFSIAGADKKFIWANAEIQKNSVVVFSDKINEPLFVRYAWADNPSGVNFYNKEGFPASPFRTDD